MLRSATWLAWLGIVFALGTGGCMAQPVDHPSASASVQAGTTREDSNALGAAPREWTWVDVPVTRCANGSSTGVAVDLQPGATQLVLFLEGGGACASAQDCWVQPTAVNIASGYGVAQLQQESNLGLPIFARSDPANPFADASYVFVPYCTGDLHAGTEIAQYVVDGQTVPTYHYGAKNLDVDLALLGDALPGLDHAWLVGDSAGGFGTLVNQSFVASAFGVPVDVIDDSGPGIGDTGFSASWGVRLPAGCDDCAQGLGPLFLYDRVSYPSTRYAFLSYEVDSMLPAFYGATASQVAASLAHFEDELTLRPNAHSFVAGGVGHVVMSPGVQGATRAQILGWLEAMVAGDPAWQDARPNSSRSAT